MWQVVGARAGGQLAVLVAIGAEKSLFQGHAGGTIWQDRVAHVGVRIDHRRHHHQGAVIEAGAGRAELECGDGVSANLQPGAVVRPQFRPVQYHAVIQ